MAILSQSDALDFNSFEQGRAYDPLKRVQDLQLQSWLGPISQPPRRKLQQRVSVWRMLQGVQSFPWRRRGNRDTHPVLVASDPRDH
jgi:hypothetical protein